MNMNTVNSYWVTTKDADVKDGYPQCQAYAKTLDGVVECSKQSGGFCEIL